MGRSHLSVRAATFLKQVGTNPDEMGGKAHASPEISPQCEQKLRWALGKESGGSSLVANALSLCSALPAERLAGFLCYLYISQVVEATAWLKITSNTLGSGGRGQDSGRLERARGQEPVQRLPGCVWEHLVYSSCAKGVSGEGKTVC